MKTKRAVALFLIFLIVGVAVGALLIKKRKEALSRLPTPKVVPPPVEFATVKEGSLREKFSLIGTVEPKEFASVSTVVAGKVLKVFKKEGESFKKGELLALLDSSEITSSVLALQKEKEAQLQSLKGLKSQLEAAKVALTNAKKEYERELYLYKNGAVPKEAVEKAQNLYHQAKAQVDNLKAQIKKVQLSAQSIEKKAEALSSKLKYTEIRAVEDGVVSKVILHPGSVASPGRPIMEVFYPSRGFRVLVPAPPEVAREVEIGARAKVEGADGVVSQVLPSADKKSSLPVVEVSLKEVKNLKPFQKVEVELSGREFKGVIVPASALLHLKDGVYALLIEGERVRPVKVELLAQFGDKAVVKGLKGGEKVVVGRESKLLEVYRLKRALPAEELKWEG